MFEFDHVGITTTTKQPQEDWVEQSRLWVTNPRNHPEHIEFLRYEPDSPTPDFVKNNPHVAYRIDDMEKRLAEADEVLILATIGKLDDAQPIARGNQPHRLGIDGDRARAEQAGGNIFFVEVNSHSPRVAPFGRALNASPVRGVSGRRY